MNNRNLKIERLDEGSMSRISLFGIIDEDADLSQAFAKLKSKVLLNLEGITLINSCGVREWVQAVRSFPKGIEVIYEKCPPRIVEQANSVSNFLGNGRIATFFAPYFCSSCNREVNILLAAETAPSGKAPSQKCPTCKGAMDFDEVEEEYFSFLEGMAS